MEITADKYFITGTDTSVGKTYVSTKLLQMLNQQGYSTIGIKPVSSGCYRKDGKWYNEDAVTLQQHASIKLGYDLINPFAFAPAIAPHIAAGEGVMTANCVLDKVLPALNHPADFHIIEGAGGWYTPLNSRETMADFVKLANLKIILVVGIRLGCINHAILTYHAIKNSGLGANLQGWIANCLHSDCEIGITPKTAQGLVKNQMVNTRHILDIYNEMRGPTNDDAQLLQCEEYIAASIKTIKGFIEAPLLHIFPKEFNAKKYITY